MNKLAILLAFCTMTLACKDKKETEQAQPLPAEQTSQDASDRYNLSLAQWSMNKAILAGETDPMDFAADAKAMGFEGLEYVSQLYVGDNVDYPMKDAGLPAILEELKRRSDSLEIKNLLIMVDNEGDLSDNDTAVTQQAVENHKKWVDAAAYLGCHSIRVNLFGSDNPEQWIENSVRSLKALCAYAAPKNVNILVENHGGLSSHGALLARVMKEVAMENCGTLPDFGNFCLRREGGERWGAPCVEEYDKYMGVTELMPYAKGVSAKAYDFDEDGNETTIDFYRMLKIIDVSGFEGFIGIEYEGDNPGRGIAQTRDLVLKAIDNL